MNKYQSRAKRLLVTVLLLLISIISIFMGAGAYAEIAPDTKFESVNIMNDLKPLIENNEFDIKKHPFSSSELVKPGIFNFVEYCYSPFSNMQKNYGLYVYFYNPRNTKFVENSNQNKIQIATKFNENLQATNYEKLNLQFCNKSENSKEFGSQYNKFLKFKIVNAEDILNDLNSEERRYCVSDIELLEDGQQNAEKYLIGGKYIFSGYAKGYGPDPNSEDTLNCSFEKLETIVIDPEDIGQTSYNFRANNEKGAGWHNQINAVYFSVPNGVIEEYGSLQKIKFETYRYKTVPIFVTKKESGLYETFFNNRGNIYGTNSWNIDDTFIANPKLISIPGGGGSTTHGDFVFGKKADIVIAPSADKGIYRANQLPYVFEKDFPDNDSNNFMQVISSRELLKYIYEYNASYHNGRLPHRQSLSADLFIPNDSPEISKTIDAGDIKNLYNYNINDGWNKIWYNLFGALPDATILPIKPIEKIDHSIYNTDTLYINPNDTTEFHSKIALANTKDRTMHMFRFALDDYYSHYVKKMGALGTFSYTKSFMAQTTAYLDFDILELTFNKDGKYTMLPVAMSPMDVISGINSPSEGIPNFPWELILLILLLILLLPIIIYLLPLLLKLIWFVISAPFKAIASIFKKGNKSKNSNTNVNITVSNGTSSNKKKKHKQKHYDGEQRYSVDNAPAINIESITATKNAKERKKRKSKKKE